MKSIASTPHSTGSQEPHRDNVAGRNPITSEVIISKLSAIPNLVDKDITRTAREDVIADLRGGYISLASARADYGLTQ